MARRLLRRPQLTPFSTLSFPRRFIFPCPSFSDPNSSDDSDSFPIPCESLASVAHRMYYFSRPRLLDAENNRRVESILSNRGWDLCLNCRGLEIDSLSFYRMLCDLYDASSDAALTLYFFRLWQKPAGTKHELLTVCTMIHISVLGNMNHLATKFLRGILTKDCEGEEEEPQEMVFDTLRKTSKSRKVLETVYSMLLKCYLDKRMVDKSMKLMERMEKFGFFPSVGVYPPLFKVLLGSKQYGLVWEIYGKMPAVDDELNKVIWSLFMHQFRVEGDFDSLLWLFLRMQTCGHKLDVVVYSIIVDGLCKKGLLREATSLLYKLIKMDLPLDCVMISSVIDGYCKVGKLREAIVFLNFQGCVADVFMYNSFISQLCTDGNVKLANMLLYKMLELGVYPDLFNYDTLISGYCKAKKVQQAFKLLGQMIKFGYKPSVLTYTVLIEGHGKKGELQQAEYLFEKMIMEGLKPDVVAFNTLIYVYCQKYDYLQKAYGLKNDMVRVGVFPDIVTYNIIMHGFIRGGFVLKAKKIYNELVERGLVPDQVTLTNMICVYFKLGDLEKVYLIWCKMVKKGIKPDLITGSIILNGFVKREPWQDAFDLFRKMLDVGFEPDLILFNTLIRRIFNKDNGNIAYESVMAELLSIMAEQGVCPNDVTYQAVTDGLMQNGVKNAKKRASIIINQIFIGKMNYF